MFQESYGQRKRTSWQRHKVESESAKWKSSLLAEWRRWWILRRIPNGPSTDKRKVKTRRLKRTSGAALAPMIVVKCNSPRLIKATQKVILQFFTTLWNVGREQGISPLVLCLWLLIVPTRFEGQSMLSKKAYT